jgi:peptidoglycan/LPS O-acetylase OafA/YrhL
MRTPDHPDPPAGHPAPLPVAQRAVEIDGIRGWASLVVVLYHVFGEMLRWPLPGAHQPWFAPFIAADLAVAVFFVLSGDALSAAFFQSKDLKITDRLVVRRYFRLTVPILMSCLLTLLIMQSGLDFHFEAARLLRCDEWLGEFLNFVPSLIDCLRYSLINVYVAHTREHSYNPLLWTMSIEMVGSMAVFLLCYLWTRLKRPERVCMVAAGGLTLVGSPLGLFFAGVLFGHWRQDGVFERLLANRRHQWTALAIMAVALWVYVVGASPDAQHRQLRWILNPAIAMTLVYCAYTQRPVKKFFASRLSRFLGEISFPLYLVHFQVLISLMSWLVIGDFERKGFVDPQSMMLIGLVCTAAAVIAAVLFGAIERRALAIVNARVARILA